MTTLAVELVWGDKPVTVGDIAQFVAQVRGTGADDGTRLDPAISDDDYRRQIGWRVEVESGAPVPEPEVKVPASFARNLLELLNVIVESAGDVRSLGSDVIEARDELLNALLGNTLDAGLAEDGD